MRPFTLDSHLTFGYGDGLFNPDQKGSNHLWCKYSRCSREPGTFPEECVAVAKLLAAEAEAMGRKAYVMLSGGLDSEVVVKSFIAAGVPFEAITYRFPNGLNEHELKFVRLFLAKHDIKHSYFDIDINRWAKSDECKDLMLGAQAALMNVVPHMHLMNHIWFNLNGMPVLGNGDMYLENSKSAGWNYVELEYMLSWFRHTIRFGILCGVGFYQHTPEITLAMLRHPKFKRLGHNEDLYANRLYATSKLIKYNVYRSFWPDLSIRPKYGGQELVAKLFKEVEATVLDGVQDHFTQKFVVPYDELRAQLEPYA